MRKLWHRLFGHVWDLAWSMQHEGGITEGIRCSCGAQDTLDHTFDRTVSSSANYRWDPQDNG